MAVMAIIVVFMGVLGLALRNSGSDTIGLQSAQTTLVSLLNLARSHAAVSGREAELWICDSPSNPDRDLRFLVVVSRNPDAPEDTSEGWVPVNQGVYLPRESRILPDQIPEDLCEGWTATDRDEVRSTLFALPTAKRSDLRMLSDASDDWLCAGFSPRGTSGQSGNIGISSTRLTNGNPPRAFRFTNPAVSRGIFVTNTGLIRTIDDRTGFQ
jgi:hypothetical protein